LDGDVVFRNGQKGGPTIHLNGIIHGITRASREIVVAEIAALPAALLKR